MRYLDPESFPISASCPEFALPPAFFLGGGGVIKEFFQPALLTCAHQRIARGCKEHFFSSCISQQLQRCAWLLLNRLQLLMSNDFGLSDVLKVIFPSLPRRYYNYFLRWTSKKKKKQNQLQTQPREREETQASKQITRHRVCVQEI